ncbi:MAG: N-acetylmuramoyl-L-alanine amidase [Paludibacter sp.]|jgi:N-acetyl-anhydromuramyl-L-alanine amidase AmpD
MANFRNILILILLGTTTVFANKELKIIDRSVHFGLRPETGRTIEAIIIHSVFNKSAGDKYSVKQILKQFRQYHVSSHYLISRNGKIFRLVKERDVSFQAGKSCLPDGQTSVNQCSIGIELVTTDDVTDKPTDKQIKSLTSLVKNIQHRYSIKYVLRHSDIAPERKTDPWNMDWGEFQKKLSD